jgi:FAD/FMN-containing dehydrogenase
VPEHPTFPARSNSPSATIFLSRYVVEATAALDSAMRWRVVIDLSRMNQVKVDDTKRVARAEAGSVVRDMDQATQRFGLATTMGGCPTVGIAA